MTSGQSMKQNDGVIASGLLLSRVATGVLSGKVIFELNPK